jgi:hypothetical protein
VFDVHVATEHKSDPPGSAADRATAPSSPPSSRGQAFMLGDELPLEDDGRDEDEDSDDSEALSDDDDECCGGGSGKKSKAKKVEVYQGTSIKQCGDRGVSSGRDRGVFYMTLSLIILPALVKMSPRRQWCGYRSLRVVSGGLQGGVRTSDIWLAKEK